jgi:hypothetical protein
MKKFQHRVLNLVKDYNFDEACVCIQDCSKISKIWTLQCMKLKQIFETLKTLNKKVLNMKHVHQVGHYNFGIKKIQGRLRILNFEFQNLWT